MLHVCSTNKEADFRYLKSKHHSPITLLTNDNNLSIKAQAHSIPTLSGISLHNEPLSSDVLIRQVINGPLPVEKTYIRPKEGEDTRMLDLSGTMEHKIGFLPGLEASRFAPKSEKQGNERKPGIAIDPKTGAVILVKDGERPPMRNARNYRELQELLSVKNDGDVEHDSNFGQTYADIMALGNEHSEKHFSGDEMEWE